MTSRSVLIVDDDEVLRTRLAHAFEDRGFEVFTAESFERAVERAKIESPEMAVIDLRMPGRGGLDVVKALKEIDATTEIVVLTGYGSIATAVEAVKLGAAHYLPKPADIDEILAAFERGRAPSTDRVPEYEAPSLARTEWEHINRVLADSGGNVSEAARKLGIHRRSLQRKLQKYPPRR